MSKKVLFSMVLVVGIVSLVFVFSGMFSSGANLESALPQSRERTQKQEDNEPVENRLSQDEKDLREFISGLGPAKSTIGIKGSIGFVINDMEPGSPAEIVGLKKGDVILNVDRQAVSSLRPIMKMTRKDPGTPVTMIVWRYNPEANKIETTQVTIPLAARR